MISKIAFGATRYAIGCATGYVVAKALRATNILNPNDSTSSICMLSFMLINDITYHVFHKAPYSAVIGLGSLLASVPISCYTANYLARFGLIEPISFLETLTVEVSSTATVLISIVGVFFSQNSCSQSTKVGMR